MVSHTDKPDFSGVWIFNRERSRLEIPSPDSTTFVIEHREPNFHLERTHRLGSTDDTFSIDLTTDATEVAFNRDDVEIHARMFWDAEVLVFDSELRRAEERGTNIVRYRLDDGGTTFVAEEEMTYGGHRHRNLWIFHRLLTGR